jgi:hypothetical protein
MVERALISRARIGPPAVYAATNGKKLAESREKSNAEHVGAEATELSHRHNMTRRPHAHRRILGKCYGVDEPNALGRFDYVRNVRRQIRMVSRIIILCVSLLVTAASAQTGPAPANSSGNQMQPQGWTGPINTQSGGAPAESPQGQSPPGMQAAPQGSDKPVRADQGGVPEGTPKK